MNSRERERERKRKLKRRKMIVKRNRMTLIFFSAYVLLLTVIGICMFVTGTSHTKKYVSIYKENTGNKTDKKNEASNDKEDNSLVNDNTEAVNKPEPNPYGIELTRKVEVKHLQDIPKEASLYNGEDIADNGCTYAIKVNRQENIVTVYSLDDKGYYTVPVRSMICSTANDENTPPGLYNTSDRYDWAYLLGDVYGQYAYQIFRDILFHSVPYETDDNSRLETWEYNKLGTHASMGCVRLCVADAKWIYENCEYGTYVNIFDSDYYGPMGKPAAPYIIEDVTKSGWDPTDMTEGNPYMTKSRIYGAVSRSIKAGTPFDERAGVLAFSKDLEDKTDELVVSGTVDENVSGSYNITYSFYDGISTVKEEIVITVVDGEPPVICDAPEEIYINASGYNNDTESLAKLITSYISAYDGSRLIEEIAVTGAEGEAKELPYMQMDMTALSDVNAGATGTYPVYCKAIDINGNESDSIEIRIIIN